MQSLKEIGEKMVKQDNRSTQFPLFVIQDKVEDVVGTSDDWERRERNPENEDDLCETCAELSEKGEELKDCDDCLEDAYFYYKTHLEFDLRAGVFFTSEACQRHIDENDYHYNKPRTYAVSAWRNPEMQSVLTTLCEMTGEVPSHYK